MVFFTVVVKKVYIVNNFNTQIPEKKQLFHVYFQRGRYATWNSNT